MSEMTISSETWQTHWVPNICSISLAGWCWPPSGPGLANDLLRDPTYRVAVIGADVVLPDNGAMVMVWNLVHCFSRKKLLRRLSGLKFLRALLDDSSFREEGATFWVMASERDLSTNLRWLQENGFAHLTREDCYVAPLYAHGRDGSIVDPELLQAVTLRRPRYIILNIGGGTQEQLGWWLRSHVPVRTAIVCTGAAIAFLSGIQASIPSWADRLYLGWLLRCLSAPSRFFPRYWEAKRVLWIVLRHRAKLPPKVAW